jgi:L-2-hydroxyglutarate oxidase
MQTEVVVIGGGIIGLASALQLLQQQPKLKLVLLEKEQQLAAHQTGHNSGVIHSGLYYKPGSLKATNCIRGYNYLVDFAEKHNIPFDLCGKVVVATDKAELPALEILYERGKANGLSKIEKIGPEQLREREPHCAGIEALWVPYTGIIDYVKVAKAYAAEIEKLGGEIITSQQVQQVVPEGKGRKIITNNKEIGCKVVVNCAGLYADKLAKMTTPEADLRIIPFRGEYYELKQEKQYLVKNLIYPVPDPAFPFLGVHFTRMAKGGVEAGPNAVFSFKREGYKKTDFHLAEALESIRWPGFRKVATKYWRTGLGEFYRSWSKPAFVKALQKLIPEIQQTDLVPGGAGVRAQACDRNGGLIDDFIILEAPGVVNVCNAPSPAATSSLSIGETVAQKVAQHLA